MRYNASMSMHTTNGNDEDTNVINRVTWESVNASNVLRSFGYGLHIRNKTEQNMAA